MVEISEQPPTIEEQLAAMAEKLSRLEAENAILRKRTDSAHKSAVIDKNHPRVDQRLKSPPVRNIDFDESDEGKDGSDSDEDYLYHTGDEEESSDHSRNTSSEDQTESHRSDWRERGTGGRNPREHSPERSAGRKSSRKEQKEFGRSSGSWVERELTELREMLKKKEGEKTSSLRASTTRCTDNPFVGWISLTRMPRRFTMPHCKQYEGNTDPEDHVAGYKHRMSTCHIPEDSYEAVLCKAFSSSLGGAAQRWYSTLAPNSIRSFAELMTKFVSHFSHNKKSETDETDLYEITQGKDESLRKFVKRFNDAKIAVPDCREKTAIAAFIKGLTPDTRLHIDLMTKKPRSFSEILRKAEGQMAYEEDLAKRKGGDSKKEKDQSQKRGKPDSSEKSPPSTRRKSTTYARAPYQRPPYVGTQNSRARFSTENGPKEYIPYNLSVPAKEVVAILKNMGDSVRWPEKNAFSRTEGHFKIL